MLSVITTLLLLCCVGAIFCFMGRKIFYPLLYVGCFIGGVSICLTIFETTFTVVTGGLLTGILFALLTKFLYKTSLALSGGVLGFTMTLLLFNGMGLSSPYDYMLYIVVALIFAIVFVSKSNRIIILSTSLSGASLLGSIVVFLSYNITTLSKHVYVDGFISTALHLIEYITDGYRFKVGWAYGVVTMVIFIWGVMTQSRVHKLNSH